MALLSLYVGFTVGVSFLCSLLEAAFFSARLVTLSEKKAAGNRGAALLLDLKQHRLHDAISSILVLNTIANTLGAVLAGSQARSWAALQSWATGHVDLVVGIFSGVLTFTILTVSEIIPKTLGAVYAGRLIEFVGYTVTLFTRIMAPVLLITRSLTRLVTRGKVPGISRGELTALIAMAAREGAIEGHESAIFANLLRLEEIRVDDVMTPRTIITMVPEKTSIAEFLASPDVRTFSRIPLYGEDRDSVTGYVLKLDVLEAVAEGVDRREPVARYARKVRFIPEVASIGSALRQLLEDGSHLAMVTNEYSGTSGLVTLEDIFETIVGVEIVDESDRHEDLRKRAKELRKQRMKRMRAEGQIR